MSAWTTYNTTLTCIVDETEYDIPIHNMSVFAGPYSRVAGDSVVVRAFDGRYYSRHQGWRTRATLSWDYLTSGAQEVLRDFIVAALEFGSFQAVFNPESGTQIVEMVIEDANESLVSVFDGNNRFRSVSISFVSVNISTVAPNWITSFNTRDIFWIDNSNNLWYIDSLFLSPVQSVLNLDPHDIRAIDINVNTAKLYMITALGAVLICNDDGTDLQTVFDTAFTDNYSLSVDSISGDIYIGGHFVIASTSYFVYRYNSDGVLQQSYVTNTVPGLRAWAGLYVRGDVSDKGIQFVDAPGGLGTGRAFALDKSDGDLDSFGGTYGTPDDLVVIEDSNLTVVLDGASVYYESAIGTTGNGLETFVDNFPATAEAIDFVRVDGVTYIVGISTGSQNLMRIPFGGGSPVGNLAPGSGGSVLCAKRDIVLA